MPAPITRSLRGKVMLVVLATTLCALLFTAIALSVYEVATFYGMYNLKPTGKYKLVMCTNLPCALSGSVEAAEHLMRKCGVHAFGETSADGRFTVKEGECMGACGDAPVVLVNNKKMLCAMTPDKLDDFLKEAK